MRTVLLLSLVLFVVGGFVGFLPDCPGKAVSRAEVEHAMGGVCVEQALTMSCVCYNNGNGCVAAGCGVTTTFTQYNGTLKADLAIPCGTSLNCTAPQDVTAQNCGS